MNIIEINNKDSLETTLKVLSRGGIVVFPTDTVYGIGCALNDKAIKKLYQIKHRPLSKPTAILLNTKIVIHFMRMPKGEHKMWYGFEKILKQYPKGKVTVVVEAENFKIKFPKILLKDNKIGVRFPDDKYLEKLIDEVGPIVASSANIAGEKTPKKFDDISANLLSQADLVIKSDKISSASPSTVYDIELNKIIRN